MEIGERQGLDERRRRLEVGVGLAGEARDDVGAEAEVGDRGRQALDQRPVHPDVVRPPHRPQHPVRARLKRDVEVSADPAVADDQLDQLLGEVRGQHGRQAQPAEPADVEEPLDQRRQRRPRLEVPAVVAEVHAGEDHLDVAGAHERLDLVDHGLDGLAPAPAPRERDDAEAAAVLAAVLHLHEGARVAGRDVPDGDDRQCPRLEDVAHLDERPDALPRLVEEARQGLAVLGAEDDVHSGDRRDRVRVGLGVAAGHHDHRVRVPRDGAPDGLPVRVVGAGRHRAGVDHVDLRRRLERHRAEALGLEESLDLRRVVLVQLAPERRERDGHRGQALTSRHFARRRWGFDCGHGLTPLGKQLYGSQGPTPVRKRAGRTRRRRPRPWTSGRSPGGRRRGAPAGTRGCARAPAAGRSSPATR